MDQSSRAIRRLLVSCGAFVAVVVSASTATAHVGAKSQKVKTGSTSTVGFTVEHGCDGSPTTKLAIKLPAGVSNPVPIDLKGWTASVANGIVTFTGGPLAPKKHATFSVKMKFPTTPGDLAFPVSQTCVKGSLLWAEKSVAGKAEPEKPAPVVKVVR
jgi:periplasmic copper chaperone A